MQSTAHAPTQMQNRYLYSYSSYEDKIFCRSDLEECSRGLRIFGSQNYISVSDPEECSQDLRIFRSQTYIFEHAPLARHDGFN